MSGLGLPELLIILLVVLLLFGAARLPKLARSLGEAKREFESGVQVEKAKEAKASEAKAAEARVETRPETRPDPLPETRPEA